MKNFPFPQNNIIKDDVLRLGQGILEDKFKILLTSVYKTERALPFLTQWQGRTWHISLAKSESWGQPIVVKGRQ